MDNIAILIFKLFFSFVMAIEVVYILKPVIEMYSTVVCTGCDPVISIFATVVFPIAAAFIGIYGVISVFTAKIEGRGY